MKYTALKDKFAQKIFVKPLYKTKQENRITPVTKSITIDVRSKLRGHGIKNVKVKKILSKNQGFDNVQCASSSSKIVTPVDCIFKPNTKTVHKKLNIYKHIHNDKQKRKIELKEHNYDSFVSFHNLNKNMSNENKTISGTVANRNKDGRDKVEDISDKHIQTNENIHRAPIIWLRLYPAPSTQDESVSSLVLRCVACQFGLMALLVVWTLIWWFIINYFEEPYEIQVSEDYEKEQNQLIIDLATELRQIGLYSTKWRPLIESRIQQERILTINAVERGAKLHPGAYWDLSGTFLFTVFVMTALGFGAPVPQTIWGRISAILYAALAAPTHLYLMMNLSTCIVFHVETLILRHKKNSRRKQPQNQQDQQNGGQNSEYNFKPITGTCIRRYIKRFLCLFCVGRCVPLAILLYYAVGAFCFGYLRRQSNLDIVMFPCEFTTTGGLESVDPLIRVLYGLYVEGAILLIACGLAVLKFHNGDFVGNMTEKYRLFTHSDTGLQ